MASPFALHQVVEEKASEEVPHEVLREKKLSSKGSILLRAVDGARGLIRPHR